VTVYRNFERTMLYRICNKSGGKCLGTVGGATGNANIEQRAYTGAPGQTWTLQQVSPGVYKIINKTSGMSLDVSGTQVVQRPYTNQAFPISYLSDQPGFASLALATNTRNIFWTNWSTVDGALISTVDIGQGSADSTKWTFTAVGPISIDPGRPYRLVPQSATIKSIDIANASQANGTAVQLYDTWPGDSQKLVVKDAGKGNVKLTMKTNNNKCIGPKGHLLALATKLEIQDCTGGNDQAWITGETTAGSGVFMLKNVGAPNLCLDVTGASTSNGTPMQIMSCTGANNQLFAAQLAP
jgi:hypothetical protein